MNKIDKEELNEIVETLVSFLGLIVAVSFLLYFFPLLCG